MYTTAERRPQSEQTLPLAAYIGLVRENEQELAAALRKVAERHQAEPDVYNACQLLAKWSDAHIALLKPILQRYPPPDADIGHHISERLFQQERTGGFALVRDLHDLWLLAYETQLSWTVILQAARALRDAQLETICQNSSGETSRQISWLLTRIKQAAPQALVVPA